MMKKIIKGQEPKGLREHRAKSHSNYDNLKRPETQALRVSLTEEQGWLCCYCMSRIHPDEKKMKIEHFKCQDNYPQHDLAYWNMLGACIGGKGQKERFQHCDTFKRNKELIFNPSVNGSPIESLIEYNLSTGEIFSKHTSLNKELNSVLNLNLAFLKNARKARIVGFIDSLPKQKGYYSPKQIQEWLDRWTGRSKGKFKPYCQVIVYYLQKKMKRMS